MYKTLYVDIDEEITSIIDRIRSEEDENIVLVVPKNAMLIQGIINLKLLKKEVAQMGKFLTIATNDKYSRKVIEQLEIKTQEATGDLNNDSKSKPKKVTDDIISSQAVSESVEMIQEKETGQQVETDEIGSTEFFDQAKTEIDREVLSSQEKEFSGRSQTEQQEQQERQAEKQQEQSEMNVVSPESLKRELYTKKNKQKINEDLQQISSPVQLSSSDMVKQKDQTEPQMDMKSRNVEVKNDDLLQKNRMGNMEDEKTNIRTSQDIRIKSDKVAQQAENFFSHDDGAKINKSNLEDIDLDDGRGSKSAKFWTFLILFLLLIGAGAGGVSWGYVNYPQVEVSVTPSKDTISKEIKIIAKEGVAQHEITQEQISGEFVELIISKSMDFNSTGETYESDDGKAKGKVTITNNYSSSPQPLVVTTRVLSKEGKLFRLAEDVTVPGMDGENPGKVEVDVIADKIGEDFNIGSSTFTIEGFKGGSKYEKFKVASSKPMTDGGTPDSNKKMAMVTQNDIDNARKKTIELLEDSLQQEIENKLDDGKKIMIDSVEKEIKSSKSTYEAKDVAKTFTHTIEQKIKAIVFDVEDVNFIVMQQLEKDVQSGFAMDSVSQVVFKKGIADYENKTLTMYVDAQAIAWPILEEQKVIEGIVGKNEDEIRSFLSTYPNVDKVEIKVTPSWLTTIPVSENKIKVTEKR